MCSNITVVMVNFKTPKLVEEAASSLLEHYPETRLILIDNGGCVESLAVVREIAQGRPNVHVVLNATNVGHGPALHRGFELAETPFVFTLDSDTRVEKDGFFELMLKEFAQDPKLFAIGWMRYVSDTGVPHRPPITAGHPYVHPFAAMYRRRLYERFQPFTQSGAPAIHLMKDVTSQGFHLASFPIQDYVWHKIAGTRGMFGGQCLVNTDARPSKWSPRRI